MHLAPARALFLGTLVATFASTELAANTPPPLTTESQMGTVQLPLQRAHQASLMVWMC